MKTSLALQIQSAIREYKSRYGDQELYILMNIDDIEELRMSNVVFAQTILAAGYDQGVFSISDTEFKNIKIHRIDYDNNKF